MQAVSAWLIWTPHATAALPPTSSQLQVAATARALRIYVYDPAAAGVQPPLAACAANSSVCSSSCKHEVWPGREIDLCNNGFGRMRPAAFAAAMQGHFWGNHDWGHDVSHQARAKSASCVSHARYPVRRACVTFRKEFTDVETCTTTSAALAL